MIDRDGKWGWGQGMWQKMLKRMTEGDGEARVAYSGVAASFGWWWWVDKKGRGWPKMLALPDDGEGKDM